MSHFINDKIEQTNNLTNSDNAYTLGPLQAGPPCCVPEPLIRVDNLSLHYGAKPALEGVSLDIYKGYAMLNFKLEPTLQIAKDRDANSNLKKQPRYGRAIYGQSDWSNARDLAREPFRY